MARTSLTSTKENVTFNYHAIDTARRFHASSAFIRGILGPVGGGKSVACCMDMLAKAMQEHPGDDGRRKTRWLVGRSTYPELKSTTIQTFLEWFRNLGEITYDSPIRFRAEFPLNDGTIVDWEVWFKAIDGSQDSLDSLRSLEITGAWLNEAHEFVPEVYDLLKGRVGRYRPYKNLNPRWKGIIVDSNYGSDTSPLREFVQNPPVGWEFFEQPPAVLWNASLEKWEVNPEAENLAHLPDGIMYYERQLSGMTEHNIRQLLASQWATRRSAKPIYPEFNQMIHMHRGAIAVDRNLPLYIGLDFGLHIAAVIGQLTKQGSLVILDEIWDDDAALESWIAGPFNALINRKYRNMRILICGDPAGMGRSALDKRTGFQILKEAGYAAVPSPTNDPIIRRDALRHFLLRTNGFRVASTAKRLVDGLAGAFGYRRKPDGSYSEQAIKNNISHTCEAAEYLAILVRIPNAESRLLRGTSVAKKMIKGVLNGFKFD